MNDGRKAHWDAVYVRRATTDVSWYEARPDASLDLIRASGVKLSDPIIDVGGGASFLVDSLLDMGFEDLTVLDISSEVLDKLRRRIAERAMAVTFLQGDVTAFQPTRRYALWHDRAVFHFLIDPADRGSYLRALKTALRPNGHLILATFGPQGPERCSGLPVARYDTTTLAAELNCDFRLVESSLQNHQTPSGASQQFLYCRFQLARPNE